MTILAIHKQKDFVYIASDSRYTISELHTDSGPKIFKLFTKIYGPNSQGQSPDAAPILYTGSIGLAFTGNASFFSL